MNFWPKGNQAGYFRIEEKEIFILLDIAYVRTEERLVVLVLARGALGYIPSIIPHLYEDLSLAQDIHLILQTENVVCPNLDEFVLKHIKSKEKS